MIVRCHEQQPGQGSVETFHEPVESLSKKACLICNKRDGVVACGSAGCPIVVHKGCMPCADRFDDGGTFYCPYCVYKQSLSECQKAKGCAFLAKKDLVNFLDTKAARSTGDVQVARSLKRNKPEGCDCTFQNENLRTGSRVDIARPNIPDEIGEVHSGIVDVGTILVKSLSDANLHHVMDDVMLVKLTSGFMDTKRQKTANAFEGHCNQSVQSDQKKFHETTVCSTRNETFKISGLDKINFTALQDEYPSSNQLKVGSENADQSADVQKDHYYTKTLGQSPNKAVCPTRMRHAPVTHKESGNLVRKHQWIKDTEKVYCEEVEKKEQVQAQAQASIYLTTNDGVVITNKSSVKGDDNALRDDSLLRMQLAVSSEDAGIGESFYGRTCEGQALHESPKEALFRLKKFSAFDSHECKKLTIDHLVAANPPDRDNGVVSNEINGRVFGDDDHIRNVSGTANNPDEYGDDHERTDEMQTALKEPVNADHLKRNCYESVRHTKSQQKADAVDGYCGGLVKECTQTTPEEPLRETAEEANEEAKRLNYSAYDDGEPSRNHMAVNKINSDQASDNGCGHSSKAGDGHKQANELKNVAISTIKEHTPVSHEVFDTGGEIKSSQESHHVGYALRSNRKSHISVPSRIDNQPRKPSRSSESELEEYEEVIRVKSRQKIGSLKEIQYTPVFVARRKKLPWTIEEEVTLKEGVDKFSLTTKQNMPWMKILEFGSHIFDGTRTPDDLKDKWKRLLKKACANA